jgi:nitrogen fixation protein NifU and related proteins
MDLKDLYRDVIVDHNRKPRNFGPMAAPDAHADGHNPLCGDRLTIYVSLDGDKVKEAKFEGSGCAISVASASLLTEAVKGKSVAEVDKLYGEVHELLTKRDAAPSAGLGKLAALSGVHEFPARVKCASLCWHTLNAALHPPQAAVAVPISTE